MAGLLLCDCITVTGQARRFIEPMVRQALTLATGILGLDAVS